MSAAAVDNDEVLSPTDEESPPNSEEVLSPVRVDNNDEEEVDEVKIEMTEIKPPKSERKPSMIKTASVQSVSVTTLARKFEKTAVL